MSIGRWGKGLRCLTAALLGFAVVLISTSPASAQNRKRAWEIFIYFGEFAGQKVPSAVQQAVVNTYRLDPYYARDPNTRQDQAPDPNLYVCEICRNLGQTGPGSIFLQPDPNSSDPSPRGVDVCPFGSAASRDPNLPYFDECDDDMEARYKYNAHGIITNGEVQKNANEFLLGARVGYNITRHWEVELDLGFAKQRLDMTQNLIPFLSEPVTNPADPWFQRLADFFEFTWANRDFYYLGYQPFLDPADPNVVIDIRGMKEIPNVAHHRFSRNPGADIPAVLPMPLAKSETFQDVTDFINRIMLDPTAFRNRANQINIDVFSVGVAGLYNFNTKPDSRIIPYLQAGIGQWMRTFDSPYKGENSNYLSFGGGVRFFVNEIFSFRAEFRDVLFRQDKAMITAEMPEHNLLDNGALSYCFRDQEVPAQQPPLECDDAYLEGYRSMLRGSLPPSSGAGGRANVSIETETDSFLEFRVGFDVLLGGK